MKADFVTGLALLAACAGQGTVPEDPAPSLADTVSVWVTDARDTLTLHTDSLAHLLNASALRWQVADTGDVTVLMTRGTLPLIAHGPFALLAGLTADSVSQQPLPWGRLHALVSDSVIPIPGLADSASAMAIRDDLARFAVTADAEASMTSPPLALRCDSSIARARTARRQIAYLASDPVARQIAERLAALAGFTAIPLAEREFGWALSDGRESGIVLTLPLVNQGKGPILFCGARVTPLIETRATLIMRAHP